jgi:hypothetical protein
VDFVRIIFRDLGRKSRRTAMTITSIAVSLFVFCALMSVAKLPDQMRANANNSVRLVCRNKAGLGTVCRSHTHVEDPCRKSPEI